MRGVPWRGDAVGCVATEDCGKRRWRFRTNTIGFGRMLGEWRRKGLCSIHLLSRRMDKFTSSIHPFNHVFVHPSEFSVLAKEEGLLLRFRYL